MLRLGVSFFASCWLGGKPLLWQGLQSYQIPTFKVLAGYGISQSQILNKNTSSLLIQCGEANANDSVRKNATWLMPGTDSGLTANEVWPDDAPGGLAGMSEMGESGSFVIMREYGSRAAYTSCSPYDLCVGKHTFPLLIPLRRVCSLMASRFVLISFAREHLWNRYHFCICLNYPFLGREWEWGSTAFACMQLG